MVDFGAVMTAMVTPFKPGLEVDYDRAGELAELLVKDRLRQSCGIRHDRGISYTVL